MVEMAGFVRFERVDRVERTSHGLLAHLHGERLAIELVRSDVVRLRISRGGVFDPTPTHAVCVDPLGTDVPCEVAEAGDVVRLRTAALVVSLWREPFRLEVHRPDGSPVIEPVADPEGRSWTFATLNDAFCVRRRCQPADPVYGLGEKTGSFNRRGRAFRLWNTDVLDPRASGEVTAALDADDPRADPASTEFDPYYVSIPFFHHLDAARATVAASFVDNGYPADYDFSAEQEYRFEFAGGQYVEYVFAGPRMPDVVAAYTWLTGRMPLPPVWALGYHQSRWHPYGRGGLEQVGRRHRQGDIPCDALWLDIDYMDGFRVFTWDATTYPDVPGMLASLAAQGFRVVTIIDPGVKAEPGYDVFDAAVRRDVLCRTEGGGLYLGQVWPGLTAFPDFATEEARRWWGERNAEHARNGVAGIWNDMNEPATGVVAPEAMLFDRGRASHARFHNQYALLMAMGTVQGLRAAQPQQRTFVLSRAGFAGIQRYAANWMGDNMARWDHLALSIPMANGFGISGQPFVGADIGGFMGDTQPELLTRWAQYAALTPFCRNHSASGSIDQYAWSFGDAVESRVRDAIQLRYRLLPYLYAAFVVAAETGAPVQRPLVFDHQEDPELRGIDDEFLLGTDVLVAPVVRAGATSRQVRLPRGDWYDWHTGLLVERRDLIAAAPAERIPIFARGGAVIPMWPEAPPSTAGHHPDVVELHVWVPASDGTHDSLLQEDDGLTTAALHGGRIRTALTLTRLGTTVRIDARSEGDGYPEFARVAFDVVIHGATPDLLRVDGREHPGAGGRWYLPNTGQGFVIEFDLPCS